MTPDVLIASPVGGPKREDLGGTSQSLATIEVQERDLEAWERLADHERVFGSGASLFAGLSAGSAYYGFWVSAVTFGVAGLVAFGAQWSWRHERERLQRSMWEPTASRDESGACAP